MPENRAFDPAFPTKLPLPLARLYTRTHHAKGDRERHDHAFHLIEACIKLAAAALVARYKARGARSARVDAALRHLARPSLGQWRSIFVEVLLSLGEGPQADIWVRGIADALRRPAEDLGEAFASLAKAAMYQGRAKAQATGLDLLELIPTYRNAMSDAHGGIKADPMAYREPTSALLALASALLEDAALLGGGRLVYAEEVSTGLQGEERVVWMDLTGMAAMRRQPFEGEVVREKVLPGRLFLEIPGGDHLPLYPLLHYQPGEIHDQVFFLNRAREGAGGIQFLCYSTGEFYLPGRDPVGDALLADLRDLLSWVTSAEVTAARLDELATASRADSQQSGEAIEEPPAPSGTVLGDFEILGELGRGGMAVVYLARQMSLNRKVALKVLPPAFGNDAVALSRFKQEVRALSLCDHPNVVKIFSSGEAQGTQYYAMEFIDGGDLAAIGKTLERYRSSGAGVLREEHFDRAASSASSRPEGDRAAGLPEAEPIAQEPVEGLGPGRNIAFRLAAVVRDAARGVHHIHEHGIVHRDLKPQNIMVTRSEHRPVVMDLGLAKVSDVTRSLTLDKARILGTLRYMPPEQLQRNLLEVDARADVYALGAVLYELACLRPMLDGDTEERLTTQILFEEPPPPQKVNPRLPTDLATIIAKATRKDPRERYGSAAELADDLDRFVHGEAVSAKPPTLGYLLKVFLRRHRAAVIAAVSAAMLFALAMAFWIVTLRAAREVAQDRLAQVLRLSDVKRLAELRAEADVLWPCVPEKVPDLERWLVKAKELHGRLPDHQATLNSLRENALPYDEAARARDRERHPDAGKLKGLEEERKAAQEKLEKLKAEVAPDDKATLLSFGEDPKKKPITCYFRHAFEAEDHSKASTIKLRMTVDDGSVVYLNGTEILRVNLPEGPINPGILASKNVEKPETLNSEVPVAALKAGKNLLAVEVHKSNPVSGDLRLGLELLAGEKVLVESHATWSYWDSGKDPGASWKEASFDASAWPKGPAPLGSGFEEGRGLVLELERSLPKRDEEIASLEKKVSERRTWAFADAETQWQHDVLAELVEVLERLGEPGKGLVADVEKRLEFAKTVRKKSIEEAQAKWDEAVASIRSKSECPKYGGLAISPQLGLVPVGQDTKSGLWEFAHLQTGEVPRRDGKGKLVLTEETGLVFVLIPGGTFRMGAVKPDEKNPEGSANVDPSAHEREGPVNEVTLSPFFISKYEMTQGQWLRFTGENPSWYGPDSNFDGKAHDLRHPVEQVSWEDCLRVLGRLGLVLPTEAQWEYSARAGTTSVWWTGNETIKLKNAANLGESFFKKPGYTVHTPVGSFKANAFGLHDVAGNVWEWCRDWYGGYKLPVRDGDGERKIPMASARDRVSRGGSFNGTAVNARSADRGIFAPGYRSSILGLRPGRVLTE